MKPASSPHVVHLIVIHPRINSELSCYLHPPPPAIETPTPFCPVFQPPALCLLHPGPCGQQHCAHQHRLLQWVDARPRRTRPAADEDEDDNGC